MQDTKVENPIKQTNGVAKVQNGLVKIPSINDLIKEENYEQNALMVILNQQPPNEWTKEHPTAKIKKQGVNVAAKYLPRERVEYLLSRIYGKWWLEVKSITLVANSPTVIVRLYVVNPINNQVEWQDGIGAAPIQTDSGAGATDFNAMKSAGVQMAAPAAETYAFKDAAEKFGKIFGRDLNVSEIDYTHLLKEKPELEDLQLLFDMKKDALSPKEKKRAEEIIKNQEKESYKSLIKLLKDK